MSSCFFLNVMILSGPMICDSSFTSECEKFIVSFEMIDSIEVSTNSCDFSLMWWFCLDQWFMIPIFIWIWKIHREMWNDGLHWSLMSSCFFFECDDFVWTNDLWFLIYIWMWKIYREFWNDRLHWGLDEQLWFFLNLMILSRQMMHFHLNMKTTSWKLEW